MDLSWFILQKCHSESSVVSPRKLAMWAVHDIGGVSADRRQYKTSEVKPRPCSVPFVSSSSFDLEMC